MKFLLPFILLGVSSRGDRAISGAIGNVPAGAFDDFQILLRNPLIVCGLREFHIGARLIARAGDKARLFRSAIAATVRPRSSEGGTSVFAYQHSIEGFSIRVLRRPFRTSP